METVIKQISVSTVDLYVSDLYYGINPSSEYCWSGILDCAVLLNAMHMDDIEVSALFYPGAGIRGTVGTCLSGICHRYDLIYLSTSVNNLSVLKGKKLVITISMPFVTKDN